MNQNEKLELRKAVQSDANLLYEWRNHESTKRYVFNKETITWDDHNNWLSKILFDDNRCLLIAEQFGEPVGVIRYDINDASAEINVYINPNKHGMGLGTLLIKTGSNWILKNKEKIQTIIAKVLPENIGSNKAFAKAGFDLEFYTYKKNLRKSAD